MIEKWGRETPSVQPIGAVDEKSDLGWILLQKCRWIRCSHDFSPVCVCCVLIRCVFSSHSCSTTRADNARKKSNGNSHGCTLSYCTTGTKKTKLLKCSFSCDLESTRLLKNMTDEIVTVKIAERGASLDRAWGVGFLNNKTKCSVAIFHASSLVTCVDHISI